MKNKTEINYCIQRTKRKDALIRGGRYKTKEEAERMLTEYNKKDMLKGFLIVKRLIHIPEPPTEEEKEFMKAFSIGINKAVKMVLK